MYIVFKFSDKLSPTTGKNMKKHLKHHNSENDMKDKYMHYTFHSNIRYQSKEYGKSVVRVTWKKKSKII